MHRFRMGVYQRRQGQQLVVQLILPLAAAGVVLAAGAPPPSLEGWPLPAAVAVASDGSGGLVTWDHATGELRRWTADGGEAGHCPGDHALAQGDGGPLAASGDRALLLFLDAVAGAEQRRKAAVVDLRRCEVVASFVLPGITLEAAGYRDGWLLVTNPTSLAEDDVTVWTVDHQGRETSRFDVERALARLTAELHLPAGTRLAAFKPVVSGREVWILPQARYELWRPAQSGKPWLRVEPPPCLAATGRALTGEENVRAVTEFARNLSEPHRTAILEGVKRGALNPSFRAAVVAATTYRSTLGVVVRTAVQERGKRLDLWDMTGPRVIASLPFPDGAHLLALGDGFAWIRDSEGRIIRWPLPERDPSVEFTCADEAPPSPSPASTGGPVGR